MSLILSGTDGLSDVDGSAATPALRGTDANTGIFFPAADTIAFSEGGVESMRIDSSGNVGIGTSTPAKRLTVANTTDTTTVGNNAVMTVQGGEGATVNSVAEIGFAYRTFSGTNPLCTIGYQITSNAGVGAGALTFSTRSVTTDTAPSERMRIDTSGNVGIGTASPAYKVDITGVERITGNADQQYNFRVQYGSTGFGLYQDDTTGYTRISAYDTTGTTYGKGLTFATATAGSATTERMRIDTSGNLLVGTTSQLNGYNVSGSIHSLTNDPKQLNLRNSNATAGRVWTLGMTNASEFIVYANGSTGVYLTWNATSWTSSSDERLKTNLKPIENAAAKVMSIRAVTGRFKTDDESVSRAFLIAQDVQAVLPEAVSVRDDEEKTLGVQYTDTIPLLVAALKEQQALILSLTARITALETPAEPTVTPTEQTTPPTGTQA